MPKNLWLDLESFPSSDDVLSFIETYTGEMFAFACRAGGMMAKAPRSQYNLLARYGRELGVAWHLTEELAHLEGNNLSSLEDQITWGVLSTQSHSLRNKTKRFEKYGRTCRMIKPM